jgi:hypothetical protein
MCDQNKFKWFERGKKFNNIAIKNILQSKKPLLLTLEKFCTKKINDTMWLKEWGRKKSSKIFICDWKALYAGSIMTKKYLVIEIVLHYFILD